MLNSISKFIIQEVLYRIGLPFWYFSVAFSKITLHSSAAVVAVGEALYLSVWGIIDPMESIKKGIKMNSTE